MPFTFVDRVPTKLGRVKITPENGGAAYYAVVERADEPAVAGSALSAANLNAAQETISYNSTTSTNSYKRVYLSPTGNDANTGDSTSAPMKTVKAAIRKYAKWYKNVDISLMDGTYTEDIGTIATDSCCIALRTVNSNKDLVTLNMATQLELNVPQIRIYNITLNMTESGIRPISVTAGTVFINNVRINVPADSNASCINVYNGALAWVYNCVLNGGTSAGIYGNQAFRVVAIGCTSERTLARGFFAHAGSVIEYTPTLTATQMTYESDNGKCIPVAARAGTRQGSIGSQFGRYRTYDGLLIQWGQISITPTAANTPKSATVTFNIPYTENPIVFAQAVVTDPQTCSVSTYRANVDPKTQIEIFLTRPNTTATFVVWVAFGKGIVDD